MEPVLDKSNENSVPMVKWSNMSSDERMLSVDVDCDNNEKSKITNGFVQPKDFWDSDKDLRINFESSSSSGSSSSKKPKVPDGGWGWVVVLSSLVISMIADGVSFSFGLLYIEFLNYFKESKSKTSWIGSLFMSVPLLSGPVMSALVDRYGCRKMTMLGGLISGIGFVLASFGDSLEWELIFFGFFAGLGLGLCYVTAVVSIAYWFDKYRTLAVGLGACGTGVGTFVYAPLTQFFIEEYGWRGTVLLLAGTFLNMCVCGAVMRDPEWLILEQNKNKLKSKDGSSCNSISIGEGFPYKETSNSGLKNGTSKYIFCVTDVEKSKEKEKLPSTRSVVNLPTFMRQNEKVPVEVLEQLSKNKTVFNVILENYPSLMHSRSLSCDEKLSQMSPEAKHFGVTMSMKLKRLENCKDSVEKTTDGSFTDIANEDILKKQEMEKTGTMTMATPRGNKTSPERKPVMCMDFSQHHYFRDIKLHRNSVVYRGAMMNIPRYRLRASSCPDIFRNSTTTLAKENEEKWYADALELVKAMFDFSMFIDLHFLLMSLATILLFTWFIVPYFYLAEHLTRHGYSEADGSVLLSIIGVTNCIGMVGLGWAGDQPWMNVNKTYAGCLVLCGLSSILMPLLTNNYVALACVCALFGLFFASNYSFTPSILVQLIPLERFTTAYGLILLCQGIGNLVGPPLAGWIFDVTGEWDLSFYMAGLWIMVAGVLMIILELTETRRLCGSTASVKEK